MAGRCPVHAAYGGLFLLFACQQVVFYGAKTFSLYDSSQPLLYGLNLFCLFVGEAKPGVFSTPSQPRDSVMTAKATPIFFFFFANLYY